MLKTEAQKLQVASCKDELDKEELKLQAALVGLTLCGGRLPAMSGLQETDCIDRNLENIVTYISPSRALVEPVLTE